jgi:lipoprotein-anchoring transpeptidase ErfK/SrfK
MLSSRNETCVEVGKRRTRLLLAAVAGAILLVGAVVATTQNDAIQGVTFANTPGTLYAPASELSKAMGEDLSFDDDHKTLTLGSLKIKSKKRLLDGSTLVHVRDTSAIGAQVDWDQTTHMATIHYHDASVKIQDGVKYVVVDKSKQRISAYQGSRLVLQSKVSTGREGHGTPDGLFAASTKQRMHRSRKYHFAPMPWSVQVHGDIFIHGFTSVPNRPASHGCIRMPLTQGNPAKYFYDWVDIGTPVKIQGRWTNQHRYVRRYHHRARHFVRRWRRYRHYRRPMHHV